MSVTLVRVAGVLQTCTSYALPSRKMSPTSSPATSVAAELLRLDDLGVIAEGKIADLIAMPGDPFADINVTGQVDFVMKEGVIYKDPSVSDPRVCG